MRLHNKEINNLAVYTGVNTDALRRFIGKYNLDVAKLERNVMKYKRVRLDLAAAITGYENNELALDFAAKYRLDENKRAAEFFATKHGKCLSPLKGWSKPGNEFRSRQAHSGLEFFRSKATKMMIEGKECLSAA